MKLMLYAVKNEKGECCVNWSISNRCQRERHLDDDEADEEGGEAEPHRTGGGQRSAGAGVHSGVAW